jgi:hypothetical protein
MKEKNDYSIYYLFSFFMIFYLFGILSTQYYDKKYKKPVNNQRYIDSLEIEILKIQIEINKENLKRLNNQN